MGNWTGRFGELRQALSSCRQALWTVGLLSARLNLLMPAGSIDMMLVYDSVIPSRSLPAPAALFLMVDVIYAFQRLFDSDRSRLLVHIGVSMGRRICALALGPGMPAAVYVAKPLRDRLARAFRGRGAAVGRTPLSYGTGFATPGPSGSPARPIAHVGVRGRATDGRRARICRSGPGAGTTSPGKCRAGRAGSARPAPELLL